MPNAKGRVIKARQQNNCPSINTWYYNVVAHPLATVEVGTAQFQAQATIVAEPEHTRLYDQMAAARPNCAEYQRRTSRRIPVIVLTRV